MPERLRHWLFDEQSDEQTLKRRLIILVSALAVVVRLLYYLDLSSKPYFGVPLLDSRWWVGDASRMLAGEWFSGHALFRPPLYTLFLAGWLTIAGKAATALVPLVQALLGAGFCALVSLIAVRCWSLAAGVAAGCLAALYAPLVFYEQELLSDGPTLLLLASFLLLFMKARQSEKLGHYVWSGVFAGAAAITRANAFPIAAVFVVALLWRLWRAPQRKPFHWAPLFAFGLPITLMVAIPTFYNSWQKDPAFICAQGGINFYLGNNPAANGVNVIFPRVSEQGSQYRDTVEEYAVLGYLAERYGWEQAQLRYEAGERPRAAEVDAFWYRQGLGFLFRYPVAALKLYGKKLLALINNFEVRNNRDFEFARKNESLVLRYLPFGFGIVFALACVALICAPPALREGKGWLILYLVASAVMVILYFVAGRLRLVVLPSLLPLAGIGVDHLIRRLLLRDFRELVRATAIFIVAGTISCYQWPQVDYRFSHEQVKGDGIAASAFPAGEAAMLANASLENGQIKAAQRYAEDAVALEPGLAYAWLVIGNAYLAQSQYENALRAYWRALRLEPGSIRARNNLAVVLEKLQRFQEAAEVYLDVINLHPGEPRANANLAMLLYRSGDLGAARSCARIALENEPSMAPAQAVFLMTDPESTPTERRRHAPPPIPQSLLDELREPLPARIDLSSTRTTEQILETLFPGLGNSDNKLFSQ